MHLESPRAITGAEAARIARRFPSYRDFVDDALFHPTWGYYSTGHVRFGEGGHFDTFPIALAPLFGQMLSAYAFRRWRALGEPAAFEICELGAGNGQLCLDVLVAANERAVRRGDAWLRFAEALRYRIIERSPALIARQRQQLGPLAVRVTWTRADLTQRAARGAPFATYGLVFANEVLDCLAHHKVVPNANGQPGVIFVVPQLRGRAISHAELAAVLSDERRRRHVTYEEVIVPVERVPGLRPFLRRHYPEFFAPGKFAPYFACPAIEPLMRNTARLYRTADALWIDYGHLRAFHLTTPERQRVFAGPPRSGATIYRDPGHDDITFMVDFSVVGTAAEQAGLAVEFYGGQGELARRSGVRLDARARELMVRYRTLGWMLAVMGVGPERAWQHTGLTWNKAAGRGGRVRDDVRRGIEQFLGRRRTAFKLMILRRAAAAR
jgi:SAM-dependent MidA family methyltransferase